MKFRELYGLQISVLCLAFLAGRFMGGCFGKPGLYSMSNFYQTRLLGGIMTAHMIGFSHLLNAVVYAIPARAGSKYLVPLDAIAIFLNVCFAVIYAVAITFAWLNDTGSIWSVMGTILRFPWLPSLELLLLSIPLFLELRKMY